MKTKKYILAIDEGTTSCRAVLFSMRDLRAVYTCSGSLEMRYPQNGWVEQDADEIYKKQMLCVRRLFENGAYSASEVVAMGVTNQRESILIWDKKTCKPLSPVISWQCRRTSSECERIKSLGYEDMIKSKTGLVVDAYFSATKLKWLLDNVRGAREMADKGELLAGTIDSYLIYRMTKGAKHVTDVTNASRTMLFNINTLAWDKDLLDLFDIPENILPQVCECAGDFGSVRVDGYDIPIRGIAGDQQASLIGQACFEKGDVKCTYGTGAFILANIGDKAKITKSPLITTVGYKINGVTAYAFEGSVFNAGSVILWLKEIGLISSPGESEKVADGVSDSGGVILVPAFTGMGAPYWDMTARAGLLGITRSTKREHIVRAGLESIAYEIGEVFDMMSDALASPLSSLRADGGVSRNNLLLAMQADVIRATVSKSAETECTALGAAYLAGMGVGLTDMNKITESHVFEKTFEPTESGAKITLKKEAWRKATLAIIDYGK